MVCDGLRWSAMILEAQNRRKITHFMATCGRAYTALHYGAGPRGGGAPSPSLGTDCETDPESGSGE